VFVGERREQEKMETPIDSGAPGVAARNWGKDLRTPEQTRGGVGRGGVGGNLEPPRNRTCSGKKKEGGQRYGKSERNTTVIVTRTNVTQCERAKGRDWSRGSGWGGEYRTQMTLMHAVLWKEFRTVSEWGGLTGKLLPV